jgi:3',5'-cyclic-nucleotide phosphodiesterase
MMLNCLEAGALDVVQSPLDKAGILGLTVHAYRIYKTAKKEQAGFLAQARGRRKQSWVGVEDEEKPYAYMREAMVKKLLKGICEPETVIEDYQHRELHVEEARKSIIAHEIGNWSFCAHDFSEDELVYAGYCMLDHALQMPELEKWRMSKGEMDSTLIYLCTGTNASTNSRSAPSLHARMQSRLQLLCLVPQFQTRCGRSPVALLLHRANWHFTALSQ